jgi:hypothetical protein
MPDILDCLSRLYKCRDEIAKMPTGREKIDLQKMYQSVTETQKTVNNLWIECRRISKVTAQYEKSLTTFDEAVSNLEQYITLAYLTKGI